MSANLVAMEEVSFRRSANYRNLTIRLPWSSIRDMAQAIAEGAWDEGGVDNEAIAKLANSILLFQASLLGHLRAPSPRKRP
ncbi:MAG TPA: hypothetical protein VH044_01440 [Polyangiaceae bacterium]|jgi:hypothetical protein|nr:hypothetical protein [Polyangiaceae bacterium]